MATNETKDRMVKLPIEAQQELDMLASYLPTREYRHRLLNLIQAVAQMDETPRKQIDEDALSDFAIDDLARGYASGNVQQAAAKRLVVLEGRQMDETPAPAEMKLRSADNLQRREYAKAALVGLIANPGGDGYLKVVENAWLFADAMLTEQKKREAAE